MTGKIDHDQQNKQPCQNLKGFAELLFVQPRQNGLGRILTFQGAQLSDDFNRFHQKHERQRDHDHQRRAAGHRFIIDQCNEKYDQQHYQQQAEQ